MRALTTKDAYRLFHEGGLVLSEIHNNGFKISTKRLEKSVEDLSKQIRLQKNELMDMKEGKKLERIYRSKTKLSSNSQLAHLLYKVFGYEHETNTVNEEALKTIGTPFTKGILKLRSLEKICNTYLKGLLRETVNGVVHPFFYLHLVRTFRSSSKLPNAQNWPVRIKELARLLRRAIIPRRGHYIGEADYKGIEVCVAACVCKDPVLLSYIKDKTKDMHRDMAMQCYLVSAEEMTKEIRYCGKNKFVFPEFYGDYYESCAKSLWNAISRMDLKTASGIPLKEHLRDQGIKGIRGYTNHIEEVEYDFWNKRFSVYNAWRKDHYKRFQKTGFFDTVTGFRCSGPMSKNEAINYPVQGPAFHCLLWSLIRTYRFLMKEKMEIMLIGQIHDSALSDIVPEECDYYYSNVQRIMTKDIKEEWDWIITPLEVEFEVSDVNGSWFDKKKYEVKKEVA